MVLACSVFVSVSPLARNVVPTVGHGYGGNTSSSATPFVDGPTLIKQTSHEFWIQNQNQANFTSEVIADCESAMLLSVEGAPIAYCGVIFCDSQTYRTEFVFLLIKVQNEQGRDQIVGSVT